jgi:hypothetical protein
MLAGLNSDAATPADDKPGFQNLASQYHWEANYQFRNAADIYFRDMHHKVVDTVNARDYSVAWSYFDSAVLAYAGESSAGDDLSSVVAGAAALPLRFKDWIGPLYDAYLDAQQASDDLQRGFQEAKDLYSDAGSLMDGLTDHLRDYLGSRRGKLGEIGGRKVAERAMNQYLISGIDAMPDEVRAAAAPSLQAAADTVAAGGVRLVGAIKQTRTDVTAAAETTVAEHVAPLTANISQLQTSVATKVDATELTTFRQDVETRIVNKADISMVNNFKAEFQSGLASKADTAALTTFRQDVTQQLSRKAEVAQVTAITNDFNAKLAKKLDTQVFEVHTIHNILLQPP